MKDSLTFKFFLLNEDKVYLGHRVGDILNALQELVENGKAMGTRQLVKNSDSIVNQIRRILHSDWQKEEEKYLKTMQKVAVAIMRAIDEKDDLESILSSASDELQKVQKDLGTPMQDLGAPEGEEASDEPEQASTVPPEGKDDKKGKPQPQQAPPGVAPPAGSPPEGPPQPPQQPPPQA